MKRKRTDIKPEWILNGSKTIRIPPQAEIKAYYEKEEKLKATMTPTQWKDRCKKIYKAKKYGRNPQIIIGE